MNKVIKFRAWDKGHGKMIYKVNLYSIGGNGKMNKAQLDNKQVMNDVGFSCEVMQFTGLLDSQGKDAYFDDLCHLCDGYGEDGGLYKLEKNEYGEPFFVAVDNQRADIFRIGFKDYFVRHGDNNFKIIGNLYENPELLTQTN